MGERYDINNIEDFDIEKLIKRSRRPDREIESAYVTFTIIAGSCNEPDSPC